MRSQRRTHALATPLFSRRFVVMVMSTKIRVDVCGSRLCGIMESCRTTTSLTARDVI